jgi:XFP C-terminal domain
MKPVPGDGIVMREYACGSSPPLRYEFYHCDKQMHLQYLDMDAGIKHCTKSIGIWDWASND